MRDEGYKAAALHGDLRQGVRNRTLDQLRNGKIQFLVATDVAARGIDICDVSHVINYDLPRFCEDYVHRIGRTGRAGKSGTAISFVLPTDFRHLQSIERYLGKRFKLISDVKTGDAHSAAVEDDAFYPEHNRKNQHKKEQRSHSKHHKKNPSNHRHYKNKPAKRKSYKNNVFSKKEAAGTKHWSEN